MNNDRGFIKWIPFNSLIEQKKMVENLLQEKQKIKKPILSLEQQDKIEKQIIEAYYEQIEIKLEIYKNGRVFSVTSSISELDIPYHKIILTNHQIILFDQILKIIL